MGRVIVFEGIDGSGTTTQIDLLADILRGRGEDVAVLEAPGPAEKGPVSRLIREYLAGEHEFSPLTLFLLFSAVHLQNMEEAMKLVKQGKTVIIDRYIASAVAYQSSQGVDMNAAKEFAKRFGSGLDPTFIYLRVSPETGSKRKMSQRVDVDRHEMNMELLRKASEAYDQLISESFLGEWNVIDGEKPIGDVLQEITKALSLS